MSKSFVLHAAAWAVLATAAALPVRAESFTSSASSAGSAASSSVSESIESASDSSTRDKPVAEGPYRVMEVAQSSDRPERMRLTLRATAPGPAHEFYLHVPHQALRERPLAAGDLIHANQRPYGFEFAHADTRRAFFLVLNDGWHQELDSRPVAL